MIRLPAALLAAVMLAACSIPAGPPRQVPIARAGVLPLALSDDLEFRKVSIFLNEPRSQARTHNEMILFERQRVNYGAVTGVDYLERVGQYFNIWWRAKRPADITVRFEYRQENLGSLVQAKELQYRGAKGTIESKFCVIGDEYTEAGKATSWRVLLIENGRIVAVRQSLLWN